MPAEIWMATSATLAPWLFLAPGMLMFSIYVIIPIFQSIWISFYDWDGLGPKTWIGLDNYVELLTTTPSTPRSGTTSSGWCSIMLAVPAGWSSRSS